MKVVGNKEKKKHFLKIFFKEKRNKWWGGATHPMRYSWHFLKRLIALSLLIFQYYLIF